ncbi:hypothetical protein D9613_007542 [Agrocybe pediades]|uniref:Uncharacterized protein n=1 Tax=Agrocybe pediades TaxID=84607 RepID=A0A8H4QM82_9AGAR|nr:hypothetical protein D9613_007542 [Agrocybe pediades]
MFKQIAVSLALCALASFATVAAGLSDKVLVNLRVEGTTKTHFEGFVWTSGHNVTTKIGGNHHCDGTNNDTFPHPGPTATTALADSNLMFDGEFFPKPKFDDFLISNIEGESNKNNRSWGILLNFQDLEVGGCQQQVRTCDKVLFAFDKFNKKHILELTGPALWVVDANKSLVLTVRDGRTGLPVQGANVNGQLSDADGKVSVTFAEKGVKGVKAEKDDSIRSNKLEFLVV